MRGTSIATGGGGFNGNPVREDPDRAKTRRREDRFLFASWFPRAVVCFAVLRLCAIASSQPFSPAESLALLRVEPGFRVELFAAEPDVVDPVAMAFDERGRAYVCEMREMEVLPALEPGSHGTIRLLEDRDGDGAADRSTVFADGLSFPGGVACFRGGVYAMCTPDLLYLRDTDGDGVADERRVVLTGFAQGNAEHRFNNLKWGFDGFIYAANGNGGGKVLPPGAEVEPLDLNGRDFRFDPRRDPGFGPASSGDGGAAESAPWYESLSRQTGGGFGLAFDDWGRRYVCHNEIHCTMVVLEEEYLRSNPWLPFRNTSLDVSAEPGPSDRVFPLSAPQQWRIDRTGRRAREQADRFREDQLRVNGHFTAACGATVYRASLFADSHRGNMFVCDAAQNLVHRATLDDSGTASVVARAEEGTEFLRSTEQWFRPVNLEVGPDGALYVLDFHREIIETAASIPDDILAGLDLRAGADMGRIYRILPEGAARSRAPDLAEAGDAALVEALGHSDAWFRLTAQRLLLEREARGAVPSLKAAASDAGTPPLGRLHALTTLAGLGSLDPATMLAALEDAHPRVREAAARLAGASLAATR